MAAPHIFKRKLVRSSIIIAAAGFILGAIMLVVSLSSTYSIAGSTDSSDKASLARADAKLARNEHLVFVGDVFLATGVIGGALFAGSAVYYGRPSNTNHR